MAKHLDSFLSYCKPSKHLFTNIQNLSYNIYNNYGSLRWDNKKNLNTVFFPQKREDELKHELVQIATLPWIVQWFPTWKWNYYPSWSKFFKNMFIVSWSVWSAQYLHNQYLALVILVVTMTIPPWLIANLRWHSP